MFPNRVLVAMSGGVDSSAAALLLQRQGYEVVGITMKTWDFASSSLNGKETGCCNLDSFNDARMVAVENGFPHYVLDLREEFNASVVDNFVEEYLAGHTPNPCVMCNTHIKWRALLKKADQLGCAYIATGHYAHIKREGERFFISRAKDESKDQSYVLWGLSQEVLRRTLFPVADYEKSAIRKMISDWGYGDLSKKKDSYEICFIPDNNYHDFLKKKVSDFESRFHQGDFVDADRRAIGKHNGYPFYTVGQRKGLGVAFGKPMYVIDIDPSLNEVMLGEEEDLLRSQMKVAKINWQKLPAIENEGKEAIVKIRYKDKGALARIFPASAGGVRAEFIDEVKGIAPGQSAVFYDGDDVLGGGIIIK